MRGGGCNSTVDVPLCDETQQYICHAIGKLFFYTECAVLILKGETNMQNLHSNETGQQKRPLRHGIKSIDAKSKKKLTLDFPNEATSKEPLASDILEI